MAAMQDGFAVRTRSLHWDSFRYHFYRSIKNRSEGFVHSTSRLVLMYLCDIFTNHPSSISSLKIRCHTHVTTPVSLSVVV